MEQSFDFARWVEPRRWSFPMNTMETSGGQHHICRSARATQRERILTHTLRHQAVPIITEQLPHPTPQ